MSVTIRPATAGDLGAINGIYNHYVERSTATFALEAMTARERMSWWSVHEGAYPVLVAERADEVVGWACLSPYSDRGGYRFTVEDSVYVAHDAQRQGLGRTLLAQVLSLGRSAGFRQVIAKIESSQTASLNLHHAVGFRTMGRFEQVGEKFGRVLDTELLQLGLV